MATNLSIVEYLGDGVTQQFAVNFPSGYINRTDVFLSVEGTDTPFTWISDGLISVSPAPALDSYIRLYRSTDISKTINNYTDGSTIIEKNLDDSFSQSILAMQETSDIVTNSSMIVDAADGEWEARNKGIKNVADGVDVNDAVNVGQLNTHNETIVGYKDAAEASAVASQASAVASQASAVASQASLDEFQGQYYGTLATDPTTNVDKGDMYFNSIQNNMRVFDGTNWISTATVATSTDEVTTTAGQTVVATALSIQGISTLALYINGVKQYPTAYSLTGSSEVTFNEALQEGDVVQFVVNETLATGIKANQIAGLNVNTLESLLSVSPSDSTVVNVLNYHSGLEGGGGVFYWDATKDKSEHNGGTIIDPDVTFPADWSVTTQQETWFNTVNAGVGAWVRQYDGAVNVKWFGAKGDGVSKDTLAVLRSQNLTGFFFSKGTYLLTTCELNSILKFEIGASLKVNSGQTVTITNVVDSSKQYIFTGDGAYDIKEANGSTLLSDGTGENSRQIHISWFGVFPNSSTTGVDNAPLIQKALNSVGDVRECVVDFDIGNYNISSGMSVPRGCWIRGQGTRRTVFRLEADTGFNVFETINTACKFTDFQFEVQYSLLLEFDNSYIVIKHNDCEIYNIDCGECANPIVIESGIGCRVGNIKYGGSSIFGAGSAVVSIRGGSQHSVKGILNASSPGNSHESIVHVGGGDPGNISQIEVDGINTISVEKLVKVEAVNGSVSNISISNLKTNANSSAGDMVHLVTSGVNVIQDFNISDLNGNAQPSSLLRLEQVGTGSINNGSLSNSKLSGATGSGVIATKDLGSISDVIIDGTVDVKNRGVPFDISGVSGIKIEASSYLEGYPAITLDTGNIGDDSVKVFDLKQPMTGQILFNSLNDFLGRGVFAFRAGVASTYLVNITSVNAIGLLTGQLTGTTGTDGQFNLSVDTNGRFYVENRTGATRRCILTVMASTSV